MHKYLTGCSEDRQKACHWAVTASSSCTCYALDSPQSSSWIAPRQWPSMIVLAIDRVFNRTGFQWVMIAQELLAALVEIFSELQHFIGLASLFSSFSSPSSSARPALDSGFSLPAPSPFYLSHMFSIFLHEHLREAEVTYRLTKN